MARLSICFGLMLILSCGKICSSAGSALTTFSLEDKLKELEVRLEAKIEAKNAQLEEKVTQLEAQLELNNELRQDLALKVTQLEAKNAQLEVKIGKLEAKVEQQDSFLTSLLREKRTAAATDSIPIGNNQSAVAINGLPSSCVDLKMIGHTLSGIYSVMGSAKMESVFCDFIKLPDDAGFQKFIGYADVKSTPVYFYVQRNTSFYDEYTPIPFQLARVNVGNAMNLTSGIFTAPRPGIYFFSFAVGANFLSSDSTVYSCILYLNGDIIGSTGVVEGIGPVDQVSPMSFPSTLNLKTGDQIWVQTTSDGAYIQDGDLHNIHFTGFMLEEEIVASL